MISVCAWLCAGTAAADGGRAAPETQGVLTALPALPIGSLVALLPPANAPDAITDPAVNADALAALTDTLSGKGYRVMQPEQVSAALATHMPDGCSNAATCDPRLARATLEADAVVSVAIWQRPTAPNQVAIHVRRSRGYGQSEVDVREAGLRSAAAAAVLAALEDSRLTHEVVVRIDTQPLGAKVRVDQTVSATTPARLLLLPGNHLLSIEAPGYVTRVQYVDVPEGTRTPVAVSLQLSKTSSASELAAPAFPAAASRGSADVETSPWNNVLAIALFGAAVPLLANVIYTATTRGDCVGEIDARNRCAERVVLGAGFYASVGLAGAALLGGASFLVLQPIGSDSAPRPEGAVLHWRRTF